MGLGLNETRILVSASEDNYCARFVCLVQIFLFLRSVNWGSAGCVLLHVVEKLDQKKRHTKLLRYSDLIIV